MTNEKNDRTQVVDPFFANIVNEEARLYHLEQFEEELLEIQHQNNLEIHKKQADLSRELHRKQAKSSLWSVCITAIVTLVASLAGAYFGYYLQTSSPAKPHIQTTVESIPSSQKTVPSRSDKVTSSPRAETVEQAGQAAVVSKNASPTKRRKP